MKRRGFFQAVGAAFVAAKAAPAILEVAPPPPPAIATGPAGPEFTHKQTEVMLAMELAPVVLFSGHRGCGKSYVCPYVQWDNGRTLMVTPSAWVADDFRAKATSRTTVVLAKGDFVERLRGHRFDRLIIDDAHMLENTDITRLIKNVWQFKNSKILLTAMPYGPSAKMLHKLFPHEGLNNGWYHVHAKDIHPALLTEDYARLISFMPDLKGEWA